MREGFVVVEAGTVRGGETVALVEGSAGGTVASLHTELRQDTLCLPRGPALPALPRPAAVEGQATPALDG